MPRNCTATNTMPDLAGLDLPSDANIAALPRNNQSQAVLDLCCKGNPVKVVDECVLWCELPDSMFKDPDDTDDKEVNRAVRACIDDFDGPTDQIRIFGELAAGSAAAATVASLTTTGVCLLSLALSTMLMTIM